MDGAKSPFEKHARAGRGWEEAEPPVPSRARSLGVSGPGTLGQTGPCRKEAACRARDTACPAPPPAGGGSGAGKPGCPSSGDLLHGLASGEAPGLQLAAGRSRGCCPLPSFPQPSPGAGARPGVPRAPGLNDPDERRSLCPTLLPAIVLLPDLRLCHAHTAHVAHDNPHVTVTQRCTQPPKEGDAPQHPHPLPVQVQGCSLGAWPMPAPCPPHARADRGKAARALCRDFPVLRVWEGNSPEILRILDRLRGEGGGEASSALPCPTLDTARPDSSHLSPLPPRASGQVHCLTLESQP